MTGPGPFSREAADDELPGLWPLAASTGLFADLGGLESFSRAGPWRVRILGEDGAALLDEWRLGSGMLAIRAISCVPADLATAVADLAASAAAHGFVWLLSPLVTEAQAAGFLRAGMTVVEPVVIYEGDARAWRSSAAARPPEGVVLRTASPADLPGVTRVDEASMREFWRLDRSAIARHIEAGEAALAVRGREAIGYTLATLHGRAGTIGRLAVLPEDRGRGTGSALLGRAVERLTAAGARSVLLSAEEGNPVSRRFYERRGFRPRPGRLVIAGMSLRAVAPGPGRDE
jgi:ribosomal protein S18 acetylase RimI-like enzyme